MNVNQSTQLFRSEFDSTLVPLVSWGSAIGFGATSICFAIVLVMFLIRKYTSN